MPFIILFAARLLTAIQAVYCVLLCPCLIFRFYVLIYADLCALVVWQDYETSPKVYYNI